MQLQKSLVLITKYILLVMLFNLIYLFKILIVTKKEQLELRSLLAWIRATI